MSRVFESIREQLKLPTIEGERCVHALIENASCRACIEACPENAWRLTDESLGIAIDACDGCGLCAPACPEGAILFEWPQLIRETNKERSVLLACERAGLEESTVTVPCIHLLGIGDILQLYREQIHHVTLCTGTCLDCSRGAGDDIYIQDRIESINLLLVTRGHPTICCHEVDPEDWPRLLEESDEASPGPDLNRRQFLRRALQTAVEESIRLRQTEVLEKKISPPGQLLPVPLSQSSASISLPFPVYPQFDAQSCNGCDACTRICPHGAIQLEKKETQLAYRIEAANCTGCKICVDICDVDALTLKCWQVPEVSVLPLSAYHCEVCGAPFHLPLETILERAVCRICSRTNHYRNLHQVLE